MDAKVLKEKIILENKIEIILQELGMKNIKNKDKYYSCCMPNGDNLGSTVIYKNSLHVDAHTRNIKDRYGHTDLISLVSFIKNTYITQTIKWICDVCGYLFYEKQEECPETLKWLNEIYNMNSKSNYDEDNEKVEPIDEKVLLYFGNYSNQLFLDDGISKNTQLKFELGYDLETHSVTIPIRDEIGTLVGVKARLYKKNISKGENKYFYIFPCSKSKILYGLDKTLPYIKEKGEVLILESEKSVQQLWSNGIKNSVAIGGHVLSKTQVKKITHLGVNVVLAYDQDVGRLENGELDKSAYKTEFDKFLKTQPLAFLFDKTNKLLKEKESPSDNFKKFKYLYENKIVVRK